MGDTKQCSKCKETKSVEEFHKNRSKKDGLHYCYKVCVKQYYQENKEKILEYQKQYHQENREKILEYSKQYSKQYYQENREKILEYNKQHYKENREEKLEYSKHYYQENKEKISEYNKQHYKKNKDYYYEYKKQHYQENKDYYYEYRKQYYQENKGKVLERNKRRKALKRSAIPDHLIDCDVERQRLVAIYELRRRISDATGVEHHVDHMWPLSKGGPHWSGNLQIITAEENLDKRDSVDEELVAVIQSALDEDVERYRRHGKDGSTRH